MQKPTHGVIHRTQNMDAREQQIDNIADTFSDILTVIIGNLEVLQRLIRKNPRALGRIDTALKSARRGISLPACLRELAHQDQLQRKRPPNHLSDRKARQE